MSTGVEFKSSKTEHDENFPVASLLIAPRFRTPILAFYRFARAADDAADHPTLSERDKFTLLDALERTLLGESDAAPDAIPLRGALAKTGLAARHPLELLAAFRQDVTKRRYRDWDDLMQYCRYSAMPVGRFVLDVHGESQDVWPASDALCSALQIINHLQDCAKDYRALDRVYVPLDALDAHGANVQSLAASVGSPELRGCLASLSDRTAQL
ncbi:MAG: squalene/phytoene synthase family protein, partial [Burkholderiales bacterium]